MDMEESKMLKTDSPVSGEDENLKKEESREAEDPGDVPLVCSCRLFMAFVSSIGVLLVFAQRVGLSMAIVCMVNQTALQLANIDLEEDHNTSLSAENDSSTEDQACVLQTYQSNSSGLKDGPFMWEKTSQGHILGAYFYGYVITQVPAGILSERYGAKNVLAAFVSVSTIATLLSPAAAKVSYIFLIVLRIFVGIGSGGIFPVFHNFWSKWAPPYERSKLAGITYAGGMLGNVLVLPLSGLLCQYGFAGGWPSVFYVFGSASVAWLLLWMVLVSDTPSSHPRISEREKRYIVNRLKGQTAANVKKKRIVIPWLDILKSWPVWAIIVANFTSDWGLYTLLTNMPTYMFEVLRFDINSNGLYSALPFIAMWINMNLTPIVADKLQTARLLTTTQTRKLCNTIGMVGAAVCLVILAFLDCSQSIGAVILLTLAVGISGTAYTGFLINHIDIAPKFAGTLFGLSNCIAATSGFIAPYTAAVLTKNQTTEEWQRVFFIAAAIYVFGAIFFIIFASGNLQHWARETDILEEIELKSDLKILCEVEVKADMTSNSSNDKHQL